MGVTPSPGLSRGANRSLITVGSRLVRRLFRLHGGAVDNAADSVRDDTAARHARHSAAEAVADAAAQPPRDHTLPDPQYGARAC